VQVFGLLRRLLAGTCAVPVCAELLATEPGSGCRNQLNASTRGASWFERTDPLYESAPVIYAGGDRSALGC